MDRVLYLALQVRGTHDIRSTIFKGGATVMRRRRRCNIQTFTPKLRAAAGLLISSPSMRMILNPGELAI